MLITLSIIQSLFLFRKRVLAFRSGKKARKYSFIDFYELLRKHK